MNKLFLTLSFYFIHLSYLTELGISQIREYTILLEEDGNSVAFIIRSDYSKQYGKIIQFGGYKWFRETLKIILKTSYLIFNHRIWVNQ